MLCPDCHEEFRATGVTWLGVFEVTDMTDDEIHEMAVAVVDWQDRMSAQSDNWVHTVSGVSPPPMPPSLTTTSRSGYPLGRVNSRESTNPVAGGDSRSPGKVGP